MKTLIIDGHNTIHKIFFLKQELCSNHEVARNSLICLVDSWRLRENYSGKIYIVFDGQDYYQQYSKNEKPVTVVYSKTNESADSRIISMVRNAKDRSCLTVVTCDEKDIGSVCRPLGAKITTPDFLVKNQLLKNNNEESDKKISYKAEKEINDNLKKIWNIT